MASYRAALTLAMLWLAACASQENVTQLQADLQQARRQAEAAQAELQSHRKGTVVHDLIALRLAVHRQTVAMLEQKRAASRWYPAFSYTVSGKGYEPPADVQAKIPELEERLKRMREERAGAIEQAKDANDTMKPLHVMSAATRAVTIAQLEYQLAAYRHGFPPYAAIQLYQEGAQPPPRAVTLPNPAESEKSQDR